MARPGPETHAKRQRENAKKEKRRAKEQKKASRKAEKAASANVGERTEELVVISDGADAQG